PYYGEDGRRLFTRRRDVPGKPRFLQPGGVRLAPYGLDRLAGEPDRPALFVAEGESDTATLWFHNYPALGLPGSSAAGCLAAEHVAGFEFVYVAGDADEAGETFNKAVAGRLGAVGFGGEVRALCLPPNIKDISELHVADPGTFCERLGGLVRNAR